MKYTYNQEINCAQNLESEIGRDHGLWDLTVLSLLREAPMHPYEMRRLLRERHKDQILVLKPGSLYHAINRLRRSKLIEPMETTRSGGRPERTTYRLTGEGLKELMARMRRLVAAPRYQPSEAMASVSFLVHLSPEESSALLAYRAASLENEISQLSDILATFTARAGRINMLETEYALAMRKAELNWTRALIDDLTAGRLTWDIEAILNALRALRTSKDKPHLHEEI